METLDLGNIIHAFAGLGVPALLIGFAVFAASRHLAHVATVLIGVTVMHFAFAAFWHEMLALTADGTPVLGTATVATWAQPSLHLAASCARVWLGFADYCPVGHDQVYAALRWMIGGTA